MRKDSTKKMPEDNLEDDLRPEYDFSQMSGGVRGKYTEALSIGDKSSFIRA